MALALPYQWQGRSVDQECQAMDRLGQAGDRQVGHLGQARDLLDHLGQGGDRQVDHLAVDGDQAYRVICWGVQVEEAVMVVAALPCPNPGSALRYHREEHRPRPVEDRALDEN